MFIVNMVMMAAMFFRTRSEMNFEGVYGTISRIDYLQSLLDLFFFRIFKSLGHATTFGVLFVMVMAGTECQQRLVILEEAGSDLWRILADLLVVQVDYSNALPISLSYS